MPDLSNKASHRYWFEYPDPMIYKVLSFMEGVEDWTLDGDPTLEDTLKKLGNMLDKMGRKGIRKEAEFVKITAAVKATRSLRILQCLDMGSPGSASKVISHAERSSKAKDDIAGVFLKRNIVFERLRLLGRIFSKERLNTVVKALEEEGTL